MEAIKRHEGCNVFGSIETQRGKGNFHFAPGHSFSSSHTYLHDFGAFKEGSFDTSHTIHHLSFGQQLQKSKIINPLDNTKHRSSDGGTFVFQYYAKVVPTRYNHRDGSVELTNQYSVTVHEGPLVAKEGFGIPGIFFNYEFSPLMVDMRETKTPFFHFLTQVCAIIGGIFTVTGLVDRFVHGTLKSIQKKKEMGKFG
ncbi:hypothetical protein RFI_01711 [Reticulomyxa filosa]|uniref:Endoplasmic reticulum vesicle transporter C-terminal domain-containing protein n=1 Tax=Reticulomyxa filosa TaxID=46433 RepID=X6PBB3_RETFI|nr:hypothetical protein RFI_01711 [Reticulomyxa filosa]|eukprot:ETO35354.1 hypothetical protein RFI_01711 [Reticulomyxa filosa]